GAGPVVKGSPAAGADPTARGDGFVVADCCGEPVARAVTGRDSGDGFVAGLREEQTAYGALVGRDPGSGAGQSTRHRVRVRGVAEDRSRTERVRTTQEDARAAHNRQGYRVRRRRTA